MKDHQNTYTDSILNEIYSFEEYNVFQNIIQKSVDNLVNP